MKRKEAAGLKRLVEAVIIQAIEDLWSRTNRKASIEFFYGEGISLCAGMTGMKPRELQMLSCMIGNTLQRTAIPHDGRRIVH